MQVSGLMYPVRARRNSQEMASPFQELQSLPLLLTPLTYLHVGDAALAEYMSSRRARREAPIFCVAYMEVGNEREQDAVALWNLELDD